MTTLVNFLDWQAKFHIGDLASLVGLLVSILGFALTLLGVFSSRSAARRAEAAAKAAVNRIRVVDELVEFSTALNLLEEVRRLQRTRQWALLLDRYTALRRCLVALKASSLELSGPQRASIQSAIATMQSIESTVEKKMHHQSADLDVAKFNRLLADKADGLHATLVELKIAHTEVHDGKI